MASLFGDENVMSNKQRGFHGIWRGRWTFILAATGSAVGLGNIWKFPYITGENGGGAFVLLYLLCILLVGVPVMMAEVMLGREGRRSPINTMRQLSHKYNAPRWFAGIGWMGAITGFLILSFYSVIAGWTLSYIIDLGAGVFTQASGELAEQTFNELVSSPGKQLAIHSIFMLMTATVLGLGIHKGLENSVRFLMPSLFFMLIVLLGYALTTPGFTEGWKFLFTFDRDKITAGSVVVALGHSFFTLSLGMGAIMAYGAYMPEKASIGKTVLMVAVLDTLTALGAGLIIFPIVFSHGLEPSAGPGLLFQAMPIALGSLPGGSFVGALFFILVLVAAWTSAISIAEPAIAWATEKGISRVASTLSVCGFAWVLGIGTILSFSDWKDITFLGLNFFDFIDYITSNIMMPLGGLLIAVFAGWLVSKEAIAKEIRLKNPTHLKLWRFVLRYISPLAILVIFAHGLGWLSFLGI